MGGAFTRTLKLLMNLNYFPCAILSIKEYYFTLPPRLTMSDGNYVKREYYYVREIDRIEFLPLLRLSRWCQSCHSLCERTKFRNDNLTRSRRNSTQETHTSSEATARQSSPRPRGRVRRFLEKVKDGANRIKTRVSHSKNSRNRPIHPNVYHEGASLTPNLEDTQEALFKMHRRISMLLMVSRIHISNLSGYLIMLSGRSRMYIHMQRWHWARCLVQPKLS
ncbi:hypothetical protein BDR04DRAFT_178296 [Suillus decipiens]|nr:hypothetical protein BDR04DRAFT_178296 [Suillus decipiens]